MAPSWVSASATYAALPPSNGAPQVIDHSASKLARSRGSSSSQRSPMGPIVRKEAISRPGTLSCLTATFCSGRGSPCDDGSRSFEAADETAAQLECDGGSNNASSEASGAWKIARHSSRSERPIGSLSQGGAEFRTSMRRQSSSMDASR